MFGLFINQRYYGSHWAAMVSIVFKISCTSETLISWAHQSETNQGIRSGMSRLDRDRLKDLERETRELKRTNEILCKASAYLALLIRSWPKLQVAIIWMKYGNIDLNDVFCQNLIHLFGSTSYVHTYFTNHG